MDFDEVSFGFLREMSQITHPIFSHIAHDIRTSLSRKYLKK